MQLKYNYITLLGHTVIVYINCLRNLGIDVLQQVKHYKCLILSMLVLTGFSAL